MVLARAVPDDGKQQSKERVEFKFLDIFKSQLNSGFYILLFVQKKL